ncbi:hypothetical protein GOPIP_015_00190 [Gordonia polyisoprenivorans NBRC 16320 = JCM 10675]|uniref:Uncharacterized protein n=1 Tax=Gordonia polyisoprenivorans TaxID=84595 RepID=A0A846WW67_9ACTN|nr:MULTISPECIES: hypothetical protein [Gordonia]NKY05287.1 hypothetical protein [Gordonia polyisoprenivorans]OPX14270.1 hypothetical protein B1964_15885 [Gordonia sp. i37]OZC31346.1 hypothetical protein CJJ17_07535 [Gordonia polyisoprenivorans]QUD84282.1 hypothetical protein J8M97_06635 [Gordonia polyisoprenivorans]WCB35875.1 hypothetical protein PHA63_17475 [Gordonia polyisoprenivorans]
MTDQPTSTPTTASTSRQRLLVRLFDIRNIVGALLGIYGILLLIAGLIPASGTAGAGDRAESASHDVVDLSVGSSANLWVGVILLVVAALFCGWAAWRPRP